MKDNTTTTISVGDVLEQTALIPAGSIQCVVTSPPYFRQRKYSNNTQEVGQEDSVERYVERLVEVFRGVRRVLADSGTLWLNCGDCYGVGKQRLMVPARVALALQSDGWILRSEIVWAKAVSLCPEYSGSCKPSSVRDRPTDSHEMLYLFTKSQSYFWDQDAVREASVEHTRVQTAARREARLNRPVASVDGLGQSSKLGGDTTHVMRTNPKGRNIRSVWCVTPQPYRGAHFATFPEKLVIPCIKAGSRAGDTVLDPFCGSGTVGAVALRLGRSFHGIELVPATADLARARIASERLVLGLFQQVRRDGRRWSLGSDTGLTQKAVRGRMAAKGLSAKAIQRVIANARSAD